ncbi:MAG: DUF952 domain-containing protein [Emcibacteraceae bacterium]|nr:DUF952 domain-containing protein [Emcibacteraceae bacterium]
MTDENVIYKICSHDEWDNAKKCGIYQGSKDDQRDGFIHFSTKEQVDGTLKKHFKGKNNLLLLEIAVDRLPANNLKWEVSRNGESFPHLYDDVNLEAVIKENSINR